MWSIVWPPGFLWFSPDGPVFGSIFWTQNRSPEFHRVRSNIGPRSAQKSDRFRNKIHLGLCLRGLNRLPVRKLPQSHCPSFPPPMCPLHGMLCCRCGRCAGATIDNVLLFSHDGPRRRCYALSKILFSHPCIQIVLSRASLHSRFFPNDAVKSAMGKDRLSSSGNDTYSSDADLTISATSFFSVPAALHQAATADVSPDHRINIATAAFLMAACLRRRRFLFSCSLLISLRPCFS